MIGPPERAWLAVFAGMPRTGTTSLFHVLGQHPGIFQPFRKEVGFFLFHHQRGPAWFHALYRHRRPGQLGLDVTPEYFFSPDAILRIRAHVPDARVVLGVREPLDFARSLHAEYRRRRRDTPDFATFVRGHAYPRGSGQVTFDLAGGVIPRMLAAWREAFGDRLLCYDYGLFQRDPLAVLRGLESFLGLAPHFEPARVPVWHLNAGGRRQSRLVDTLLNREGVVSVLERVVPRRVLLGLARGFYRVSSRERPPATVERPSDPTPPPDWVLEARAAVRALFAAGPLVLGSGRALEGPIQSTSTVT